MKRETGLQQLVYDYLETRILFGFYKYGDKIPSIQQIGTMFHFGRTTIRGALSLLEKEGYIVTEERKTAVVVFRSESDGFEENAAKYFVPRKEGMEEFEKAGLLLFAPLFEEGLLRWNRKKWELFRDGLDLGLPSGVHLPVELYIMVLSTLDNSLILNLYWEAIRYMRFPYLVSNKVKSENDVKLKDITGERMRSLLSREFETSYACLKKDVFKFMDMAKNKYGLKDAGQIPFQWNIYRQRPQIRYTLASLIMREIMCGRYPQGGYLPTLSQMKEQFGVSLTTVRRTLSLLEELGITKSYQGKGTMVCIEPANIDWSRACIKKGFILYMESLQLLSLTIYGISLCTLESVPGEKRDTLKEKLRALRKNRRSCNCFEVYLIFIMEECPLAMVRECYGKLRELLAWGYPFTVLRQNIKSIDKRYAGSIRRMETHLETDDLTAFAKDWKELLESEERTNRAFMTEIFQNDEESTEEL